MHTVNHTTVNSANEDRNNHQGVVHVRRAFVLWATVQGAIIKGQMSGWALVWGKGRGPMANVRTPTKQVYKVDYDLG